MLLLQLAHEEKQQQLELEKHKMEIEKQVAVERLRCETEQAKIDLQAIRLGLISDGKLSGEVLQEQDVLSLSSRSPDVVHSLRLLPKFSEREPDVFFIV